MPERPEHTISPQYKSIPEEFVQCIATRRHIFPLARQKRQHVRIQYGPNDVLELTEYYGTCELCGTTRTLLKERYAPFGFVSAAYDYPNGYMPPAGHKWDRSAVFAEFERRNPVKGKVEVRDRSQGR